MIYVVGRKSGTTNDLLERKKNCFHFQVSKRIEFLKHHFTIQYKISIHLNELIKHAFLYVNENCILFSLLFKAKVLIITLVMLKKTQEQEILNFSPLG